MGISMKTTSGKILASVALVGTAAAVAGMGTYGAFTSSTTANAAVSSGNVQIALGSTDTNLSYTIAGLLPGDTVTRFVDLKNTGNSNLGSVTLKTTDMATPASPLTTDATNGLQLAIETCSVAWTVTDQASNCAGTRGSAALTSSRIIGERELTNLSSLVAGKSDFLKITGTLPDSANNDLMAKSSIVSFAFTATQRAAMAK
jgi:predicted ribosomally synthesized peptide with SipW-like signal peptide